MATANHGNIDSSISSEALGLLDCFASGLDDVIYELAEAVAAKRTGHTSGVEIRVDDIREAADLFVQCLEKVDIPPHAKASIHDMLQCLSKRIREGNCRQ